jgi:hypothetical protein
VTIQGGDCWDSGGGGGIYNQQSALTLDAVTNAPLPGYPEALQSMRDRIASGEAVLVLFQPDSIPPDMAPLEDLTRGLRTIYTFPDGVIYGSTGPAEAP